MTTRPAASHRSVEDDPPVSRLMTRHLLGIVPEAMPSVALRLMASAGVRHLPVLDGPECLGLVLEIDVVGGLAREAAGAMAPPLMGELCRPVPVMRPDERRSAAAQRMRDTGIDAVLVVEDGQLIGIVTATDLIRSLAGRSPG